MRLLSLKPRLRYTPFQNAPLLSGKKEKVPGPLEFDPEKATQVREFYRKTKGGLVKVREHYRAYDPFQNQPSPSGPVPGAEFIKPPPWDEAIKAGLDVRKEPWMYMYSDPQAHWFKHRETRKYRRVPR